MIHRKLAEHSHAIVAAYTPHCELIRVAQPSSGIANIVLYLITTHGELVLRVFDGQRGTWKPQKERAIYEHMRSIGIPAPRVLKIDTTTRIAPFIYSLSERVNGETYSRVFSSLSEAENSAIYRSLGNSLGKLHSTTFDRFGDVYESADGLQVGPVHELDANGNGASLGPFATWDAMHRETVSARLRLMEGTVFEDLVPNVQLYFEEHQHLIDDEVVPQLLHMDLHRGNILIQNGEVKAILDIEEAVVGHNEYDLMRTELANFRGQPPAFAQAFLHAYQTHVVLDDGYALRKNFYDVSRTLVWIKSLILYDDRYAKGLTSQSHHAAREHLVSLLTKQ